jgi:xanthine dehydrogenase YagS FAD-binding subunit
VGKQGEERNQEMKPFAYTRAATPQAAIQAIAQESTKFLAGGTNLIDLMKENVEQPSRLVDINRLEFTRISEREGGLRLGALAKNSDTANNRLVRERYPLVSQAILAGASPQLRNAATNGGNLMQRTRCYYFYDVAMPCNKRQPGSGCGALEGFSRIHAIFGTSPQCIATHPSDMCVALAALDAVVQVEGPQGARSIPFADFHRLPGDTPQTDTNLKRDELIVAIDLPAASAAFAANSYYLKVRDRASYAFALVSVGAALEINNGTIQQACVAMGGVAHKPWRAANAEQVLKGQRADEATFRRAADAAMQGAQGTEHNRFKIELGRRAIVRALTIAAGNRRAV